MHVWLVKIILLMYLKKVFWGHYYLIFTLMLLLTVIIIITCFKLIKQLKLKSSKLDNYVCHSNTFYMLMSERFINV